MKFNSGTEMYDYLCSGRDLYSKSLGIYAFEYNDAGALCIYSLSPEEFAEAAKFGKENDEYWGAALGWWGSAILDEGKYDDDEHRYSDDWEKRKLYLKPSLDFCDETYMVEDWMDTDDVTVEYILTVL
jgi:hypothetical protein